MKRFVYSPLIVFLLLAVISPVWAQSPLSIAYHMQPPSVALDFKEEVTQIGGNLQSTTNQSKQIIMQAKSDMTNMQSAVTATFSNIQNGTFVDTGGATGQGQETFCGKSLKKAKVKKIAKKMKEMFLTYKSEKSEDIVKSNKMREKFYIESIYTIFAATKELQNKLNGDIKTKIENAKICAEGDGSACGYPATNSGGNNEVLFTYGKTLQTLDSMVRLWENVTALKARLKALESMMKMTPAIRTKADQATSEEETAYLETKQPLRLVATWHHTIPLAFAQISYKNVSSSLADIEAEISGSNSEAMSLVGRTVEFVSPAEADNEHPLVEAEEQLEALSSLTDVEQDVNAAMNVHNMLNQLKEYKNIADQLVGMRQDYQDSLQRLKDSEQCAINFTKRYFNDPIKVWSGIPLGDHVYNHELRKGISGWALEAYETAKAAETSTLSASDVTQASLDAETQENLKDDPDSQKARTESQKMKVSVSASKQEEAEEENRRSEMLPWQIGAEAAKLLWADAQEWGTPKEKLVWEDAKIFYQQYLSRKYENIKTYLKSYTKDDVLALVISKLRGQESDISETKYQQKLEEARQNASTKVLAAASQAQYDPQSQNELDSLREQREELVTKIDMVSDIINKKRSEIADMRSVAEEAAAEAVDARVNAAVVWPASGQTTVAETDVDDKILGADNLSAAVSEATAANVDEDKIKVLEKEADEAEVQREEYEKELDELDKKIAMAKQNAQSKASKAKQQNMQAVASLKEELSTALGKDAAQFSSDVRKNLEEVLKSTVETNPLMTLPTLIADAETAAQSSLDALYAQVDAVVDMHYNRLLSLGDDLYLPSSHEQVVEIHQQLIDALRALTLSYNVAGIIDIKDIVIYAKLLDIDSSPETEGFFVGITAKERDLKAPFAIPDFSLPPVREIFHFDATDYANIKPYVEGQEDNRALTAAEFLNFGGEIPLIWQYMLKENAFIEAQFDLNKALTASCDSYPFLRGGIMPCVVKDSSIIVDVDKEGNFIRREDEEVNASELPVCYQMEIKDGVPRHKLTNVEIDFKQPNLLKPEGGLLGGLIAENNQQSVPPPLGCRSSELGLFIHADENNGLFFNEWVSKTYNRLEKESDQDLKDMSRQEKNEIAAANYASFSRNQIGDFLKHAENEKLQRENLENYEQKYDEQMDALKEQLSAFGFSPADDFDLINDEDYNLAVKKLNEIKAQSLSSAETALGQIDRADNAPVQEKAEIFDKLIDLMRKDVKAVLKVSVTSADSNNLEADLKKAEADEDLVDKYKNSLNDQAKDYNNIEDPYCANY